ncbi:MAG TPA: ribokinase [Pirellulales bacterium]|jgi:ribokinase|nr:ribokinase [Pirellulales bacterium]
MAILNFGSLNIDRVFRVGHIARPGETIASATLGVFAGGKGANQSVALARAGAQVAHAGKIGADGGWLLDKLGQEKIDTRWVRTGSGATGQAMIQVDDAGQNAIVLLAGANHEVSPNEIDEALADFPAGSWLLVQNETSSVGHAIQSAKARGMRVALNPAPFDVGVLEYPLGQIDLLCVNESEAAAMAGAAAPEQIVAALAGQLPKCEIVLTLGSAGVLYRGAAGEIRVAAPQVRAVDATAAGDTFLGYFLASRCRQVGVRESLDVACRAAALCVTRPGAMDSIPRLDEVLAFRL